MPDNAFLDRQGWPLSGAPQFDDGGARSMHELLDCHQGRHDEREHHCDRHAYRDNDKVEREAVSKVP